MCLFVIMMMVYAINGLHLTQMLAARKIMRETLNDKTSLGKDKEQLGNKRLLSVSLGSANDVTRNLKGNKNSLRRMPRDLTPRKPRFLKSVKPKKSKKTVVKKKSKSVPAKKQKKVARKLTNSAHKKKRRTKSGIGKVKAKKLKNKLTKKKIRKTKVSKKKKQKKLKHKKHRERKLKQTEFDEGKELFDYF